MLKLNLPSQNPIAILLLVVVALALAVIPSYYFYDKYQKSQTLLKNPTEAAKQEVKTLTQKVGKHIELPNEEPTIATVSDKEKLKDQPFFAKVQNGDKVLIYTQARKAILFRPSTNKIIEVSTVNIGGAAGSNTAQANSPAKLAIYNGTNTVGLTLTAEKQLKEKISNIEVVLKENASKNDYDSTIVVDISGNNSELAKQIGLELSGKVGSLPSGETKPDTADILVILGADYIEK